MTGTRVTALTALAFVVCFVVAFALVSQVPAYDRPDDAWVAWAEDSGDRARAVIGTMLWCAAGLLLMATLTGLARLARHGRTADDPGHATDIARGAGVMAGTMLLTAALIAGAVPAAMMFAPDFAAPGGDVIRMLDQLGIALLLIGCGWSSAVALAGISWGAGRTGALPRWLVIFGYVAAAILLLSPLFLPIAILLVWMGAAGIVLVRSPSPTRPDH